MNASDPRPARPIAPRLPSFLALPLGWIPAGLHSGGLALILERLFAQALANGELDFLRERTIAIRVDDLRLDYRLRLPARGGFRRAMDAPPEVTFSGNLYEFLLLATRREDADTLFFQRRLRLRGDTELGLALKNFLDSQEVPLLPEPLARPLLALLERIG